MALYILIILGIIQGITEFLPVSSSGHLVLFYNIFNINNNQITLSIVFHLATLMAVIFVYFKDIVVLIKNPFCKTNKLLVMATIPTVIIALLLKSVIEKSFSGEFLVWGFLITAVILFFCEIVSNNNNIKLKFLTKSSNLSATNINFMTKIKQNSINSVLFDYDITNININYFNAFLIGVAQGIACFPGISRSGSTIACGLFQKLEKKQVADFSFLLSIPVILGSMIFELKDFTSLASAESFNIFNIIVGFIFAFVSGILCIKFMLKIVKKQKLYIFSFYLVLLSLIIVIFNLV